MNRELSLSLAISDERIILCEELGRAFNKGEARLLGRRSGTRVVTWLSLKKAIADLTYSCVSR
jgi:hypothetical protein